MKTLSLSLIALSFSAFTSSASIFWNDQVKVLFTPDSPTLAHIELDPSNHFNITKSGYGWDSSPSSSKEVRLKFKPISIGDIWRTSYGVSVNLNLKSDTRDYTYGDGQTSKVHLGNFYVRYSANQHHWSTWQLIPESNNPHSGQTFASRIEIPEVDREKFLTYRKTFIQREETKWKSDMKELSEWITTQEVNFFNEHIPYIGWIEVMYEGDLRGSRRLNEIILRYGFGMSGMHYPPKNGVYPPYTSKWDFKQAPIETHIPMNHQNSNSSNKSKLLKVISGEEVFDRDTDSKILQASNEISARAMLELYKQQDSSKPDWHKKFAEQLMEISIGDPSLLIGFDDGRADAQPENTSTPAEEPSSEHEAYLKLKFQNSEACFYQFHLFPSLTEPFIQGCARKRANEFQYLQLTLTKPEDLQIFIQNLRSNPHLEEVLDSNAEEFHAAPSQSM